MNTNWFGKLAAVLCACALGLSASPAAAQSSLAPVLPQFSGHAGAMQHQGHTRMVPEGTNNPECKSDEIVVLVHGTDATFYADYALIGETLASDGWCVYGIDYGYGNNSYGWAPLRSSVQQLEQLVKNAMATSGATRVHMVGYSQGATLSRYWVNKYSNGRATSWFGVGSPTSGVDLPAVQAQSSENQTVIAPALLDHLRSSDVMREVNSPMMIPGVRYATFASRYDGILALLDQNLPGATNIVLQDKCPQDFSGHFNLPYNPTAVEAIRQWLRTGQIGELPCAARGVGYGVPEVAVVSNFGDQELPPAVVYPSTS